MIERSSWGRLLLASILVLAVGAFGYLGALASGNPDTGAGRAGVGVVVVHIALRIIESRQGRGALLPAFFSLLACLVGMVASVVSIVLIFTTGIDGSAGTPLGGTAGGLFFGGFLTFVLSRPALGREKS